MKEVGHPKEGQEQDPRPRRHHPHLEGEWPEDVRHYRSLPRKEGGIIDERALLLYAMVLEASFNRMALTEGTLPNSEIAQCIKEVMGPL